MQSIFINDKEVISLRGFITGLITAATLFASCVLLFLGSIQYANAGVCQNEDGVKWETSTEAQCYNEGGTEFNEEDSLSSPSTFSSQVIAAYDTNDDGALTCEDLTVYSPLFFCGEVQEQYGLCTRTHVTSCSRGDINCNSLIEDVEATAIIATFSSLGVTLLNCQ